MRYSARADRPSLQLIGGAALIALILTVPWLGPLTLPFRLLSTIVHELGHGLAALLTGGAFVRFQIAPDGSGLAYTAGGWRPLVLAAGYLGSALFGALLIWVSRSVRACRAVLGIVGLGLLLLSLRYGVPSIFSTPLIGLLTVASGVLLGALFLWVATRSGPQWSALLVMVVALQAGFNAFGDLITLIGLSAQAPGVRTDAQSMAALTGLPAVLWAVLWATLASAMLGWAIWQTWLKPR